MTADLDLTDFWEDSDYAREKYVEAAATPELVASVEAELGFRLPASYIALMQTQNGGLPNRSCCPTDVETSWAEDHVAITGFYGIGREKTYSLLGALGSKFMQSEWGYPTFGVCICDCPSAGHDLIMLDYREVGPEGEPAVVHVDQESDYEVTPLAPDFATFLSKLVLPSVYEDDPAEVLADALHCIGTGGASSALQELFAASAEAAALEPVLRNVLRTLAREKGYFALHADPLSLLVYDLLFLLFVARHGAVSGDDYLKLYPTLLAMGDGELSTKGYAPGFVAEWLRASIAAGAISDIDGKLSLSDAKRAAIEQALVEFQ